MADRFVVAAPGNQYGGPTAWYVSSDASAYRQDSDPRNMDGVKDRIIKDVEVEDCIEPDSLPAVRAVAGLDAGTFGQTNIRDMLAHVLEAGTRLGMEFQREADREEKATEDRKAAARLMDSCQ